MITKEHPAALRDSGTYMHVTPLVTFIHTLPRAAPNCCLTDASSLLSRMPICQSRAQATQDFSSVFYQSGEIDVLGTEAYDRRRVTFISCPDNVLGDSKVNRESRSVTPRPHWHEAFSEYR